MDFITTLAKAVDPEAFAVEDLWNHPDQEEAERLSERQLRVTQGLVKGFGDLSPEFKVVRVPVPHFDGDYYYLDGYCQGAKKSLSLNEKRLGSFLVLLLQLGGTVVSISAMDARVKNCHVAAVIKLHPSKKAEFEAVTGITLRDPPQLTPC